MDQTFILTVILHKILKQELGDTVTLAISNSLFKMSLYNTAPSNKRETPTFQLTPAIRQ